MLMLSILNAAGRLIFGFCSDIGAGRGLSRVWWVALSAFLMAVSHFYLGFVQDHDAIYPGVVVAGLAYGGLMAATPTVLADSFGPTYFGSNWAAVRAAPALGSLLLATFFASAVYAYHTDSGSDTCVGVECFQLTFFGCAGLCALSAVASGILSRRLCRFAP